MPQKEGNLLKEFVNPRPKDQFKTNVKSDKKHMTANGRRAWAARSNAVLGFPKLR